MAIRKPNELDFSNKNIVMTIAGTPGVGKTTLALSAPDVLLIDADNGICRVNAAHRKDCSESTTYEEVLADIRDAKSSGRFRTIAIDTTGALMAGAVQRDGDLLRCGKHAEDHLSSALLCRKGGAGPVPKFHFKNLHQSDLLSH